MKKRFAGLGAVLVLLSAVSSSQGALVPRPGSGDPRIFVVDYNPAEVVQLRATLGYQTLIEFAPEEHIENVAIGEALGWQITPNRKADLLFVKPLNEAPVTNMTVVTNLRRYAFELSVKPRGGADKSVIYTLHFLYPEVALAKIVAAPSAPVPPPPPQMVNNAYSFEGSEKIVPTQIFDDGHATFFQFRDGEAYPAIFSVDADGGEAVINSSTRGPYVVVDRTARGFVLRQGAELTHIFNDGFHEPTLGPQSPQRRTKRCWLCL